MDFSQYHGFEVLALNVRNVTNVFRLFPEIALRVFAKRGIGQVGTQGQLILDDREWYPLEDFLTSFYDIASSVGPSKMFEIGKQVPKNAPFPPSIVDVRSAFMSVDIAYHMNHRKHGAMMFNRETGLMLDGIGNYRATLPSSNKGAQILVETADVPYPCEFDRGLLSTLATRFEPNATVSHAANTRCRRDGASSCHYVVTW